jgi:3-deoxy-D-manno-octulosonic-acid transferase
LNTFTYFFVQNESSKKLLLELGKTNVAVSGDTRFDRVASILEKDNSLDFIETFKNDTLTIVAGSSWPKDENLLVDYINQTSEKIKFIIAPHNIKEEQIQELKNSISKRVVLFSEKSNKNLADFDVFIIDTIGILTKIYSYADIAYVGGGFGNPGVHNILEPATFGVPIVIGPNFSHFAEATALVNREGCIPISNKKELMDAFSNLIANDNIRHEKGHICNTFVQMNKGATDIIMKKINDQVEQIL